MIKKWPKMMQYRIPRAGSLDKDTGYQGYEPDGVNTRQPKKKPKGKELTDEEKQQNREISKHRIIGRTCDWRGENLSNNVRCF